jgi:hypothetical protein
MVFYSEQADKDLDEMLEGLLSWNKIELSRSFCFSYVEDIINACDNLEYKSFHFAATYETHRKYGEKAHTYKRNSATSWYIIYNIDERGDIFIQKIINNHLTIITKN